MTSTSLDFYETNAKSYCESTVDLDMRALRQRFTQGLAPNAKVLDAGCGSGRDSLAFSGQGYRVKAFDASSEMARRASGHTGLSVLQLSFAEMPWADEFDGVWACSSLVHLSLEEFRQTLDNLARALKNGGQFYTSLKQGHGAYTDAAGRTFNRYQVAEAQNRLATAGLATRACWLTPGARDSEDTWINLLAVKDETLSF